MSDLPNRISITDEGPREGFQIEPGPITTDAKVRLINALSETGLEKIQVCSFVSARLVPGWADADDVVNAFNPKQGVNYTALWFNARGLDRAIAHAGKLSLNGTIHTVASELFSQNNLNRTRESNHAAMRQQTLAHIESGIAVTGISVMAAFGCNFAGDISEKEVLLAVKQGMAIASDFNSDIQEIKLADTMGWANPLQIQRVVSLVRSVWPAIDIRLHLHDTRGLGISNAFAGLQCGVTRFDTTIGGLGGCPFAAPPGERDKYKQALPPGNIATEELVLLAEELGIDTGIDLDALIDVAQLAESIVGRPLPSAALKGGSLSRYRTLAANDRL